MNSIRHLSISFLRALFLLVLAFSIVACVDLSGTIRTIKKKNAQSQAAKPQKTAAQTIKRDGEVHTMLGGLGVFSTGMYQLHDSVDERFGVVVTSGMWYNAGLVVRDIKKYYYAHNPHRPIILVGHSLGANEQIKVARTLNKAGIPVALLVTVDAVSQTIVPPNVKEALNMYKPGYVPMFSGLKLRAVDPKATRIDNVNVAELKNVTVNHFTIDKHDAVQEIILARIDKVLRNAETLRS